MRERTIDVHDGLAPARHGWYLPWQMQPCAFDPSAPKRRPVKRGGAGRARGSICSMVAFLGVLVMLVAGLLRSGQRYVYCVGMQAILTHACCSGHDDADGADRTSSMTPLAAMDETPDPCCEVHRLRDLPAGTSGAGAWKSSAVAADDGPPGKVMAVGPMLPTLDGGYARCGSLTGAMRGPPNAERIAERASLRRWNERVVYRL